MAEENEDTSEDSTDVFSSKFDPLKAFYTDGLKVPDAEAPIFDNISKFETFCLKGLTAKIIDRDMQKGVEIKSTSRSFISQDSTRSILVERKKKCSEKNIIDRMAKCFGPLSALYQYMEHRIKVKIHTRSVDGIGGHIEAYIAAFDTHWNLALEDCMQVWTRKIVRKSAGDSHKKIITKTNTNHMTVVKKNKRMETLERHISQLLLRGEQIVSIVRME
ncbi:U7 snRNA-associated Sm-like protein LSm11 [Phymastichus coffea]|uniref:U7 snRNA-associated Sm-like protein LSm11 n=1 Tax=Phymastichus coffea TaxID=108790 RepID=UPI00273BFB0A|nr:U7 snRNA-associated Sm-like protein LSm11 [Phymastichus coffea]